jgi:phospholipase/carboxylesterase
MTDSTVADPKPLSLVHLVRPPTAPEAAAIEGENVRPPLLLLLHGVGSNEYDLFDLADHLDGAFSRSRPARRSHSAQVRSAGTRSRSRRRGRSATPRGPSRAGRRSCAFINEAIAAYDLDARRVFLMGFSQGAIMSLYVALTEPRPWPASCR